MGGYGSGGLAGNQSSYSSSDGSGGIHSSLDSGGMSTPSGGYSGGTSNQTSDSHSTNSLGSQAASQASSDTSSTTTATISYSSPQTNDNSNTPANGFTPSQTDSSDHLSNAGFSFNPNTTNDNTASLNGAAGSSLTPQGITGGAPYTNGFSIDSSTIGRDLSTITPNYDSEMSHYFNDTSGIQKTEDTLDKIDNAWDAAKQWGNEKEKSINTSSLYILLSCSKVWSSRHDSDGDLRLANFYSRLHF